MTVISSIINLWGRLNAALLWAGRVAGASAVALMVFIIMLQVIFRYLLDASLAWPEEGARFLMLWMTGLMAPSALRRGGFISINILIRLLPRMAALGLHFILLVLSLVTIGFCLKLSFSDATGLGGRFATDSLYMPAWDFSQSKLHWKSMPKYWMMMSLVVGFSLMLSVSCELILRTAATLLGYEKALHDIGNLEEVGTE